MPSQAVVPLGKTAAKLQAPILMHMEYKVQLPDHDWVVASKHKLIPSVYAGLTFGPNGNLSYRYYSTGIKHRHIAH